LQQSGLQLSAATYHYECCAPPFDREPHLLFCAPQKVHCMQGDFSGTSEEGGIKHCLQLEDAAVLNPVAYLNGLAKAITDKGGKIYEQTRVRKPDRSVLETEGGNKVSLPMCSCVAACRHHLLQSQQGCGVCMTTMAHLSNDASEAQTGT